MTPINVCLAVVAFGLLWPVIVFAICCATMGRLVEPFPEGEWYGQTLPPLAESGGWRWGVPDQDGQLIDLTRLPVADTRPAVTLPETVEAELRKLAAMIPDRPA